ncbi:MAG: dual specificity protein phosphatase family protein [Acidobacteria bacterium]|nr:dual specificity protein phosphatase family protein [Acidobacteriota bacterium]MBV9146951.1 dual specificity protein phosphatase family protein [Acidobacteriota bacterium]
MDMTWVTDRIAVGGGIWNEIKMIEVASEGVTHIINMQIEFDDRELAAPYNIQVLWNPTDDDFLFKPPELFRRAVDFAVEALEQPKTKIFIHCAAGVHRAPMMTLALMCSLGWDISEAMQHIVSRRPVVDFADVYVRSVREFMKGYAAGARTPEAHRR